MHKKNHGRTCKTRHGKQQKRHVSVHSRIRAIHRAFTRRGTTKREREYRPPIMRRDDLHDSSRQNSLYGKPKIKSANQQRATELTDRHSHYSKSKPTTPKSIKQLV
jgi:hypothetical protein